MRQDGEGLLVGPFERRPAALGARRRPARLVEPAPAPRPAPHHAGLWRRPSGACPPSPTRRSRRRSTARTATRRTAAAHGARARPPGLWVLAGFSFFGIVYSGGAGSYLAEWILDGQPSDSMWELDVRRFGEYARRHRLRRRAGLRELRARVRVALPGGGAPRRAAAAKTEPALRPSAGARRRVRRPLRLGAAAVVRAPGETSRATSTRSGGATGTRRSARSAGPCARRSACSTRRASPSTRSRARAPRSCSTGSARTACRRRRAHVPHADVHAARRHRVRRDGDPPRRRSVLRRVRGAPPRRTTTPGSTGISPGDGSVLARGRTERVRRPHPRRAALAGAARSVDRRRRLAGGVPVLPLPGARGRGRAGARAACLLRRRARLRAAPPASSISGSSTTSCARRASRSGSSTSATARSSRCGSRRATDSGAPTCPPDWTPLRGGARALRRLRQGRLRRPRGAAAAA